jgi:FkbM family methyltransferase
MNPEPSYSQCGEDRILAFLFKNLKITTPFYIDIGAYDAYEDSNTAIFYETGAKGINIEPNIERYRKLLEQRKRDVNLNVAISGKKGKHKFYKLSSDKMNTLLKEKADELVKTQKKKILDVIEVKTITFNELMEKYCQKQEVDLLNTDAEDMDLEILKSIDWNKYTPLVICAETASYARDGTEVKYSEIIHFLESKGYMIFADTRINTIFVKKDKYVGRD